MPNKLTNYILTIFSLLYLVSGCNSTAHDTNNPETDWSVTLNISGGFAGVLQTISLDQTGKAIFTDNKTKSTVEKQLSNQDVQVYAELVRNLPVDASNKSQPNKCRDCFNYSFIAVYDGTQKHGSFNSVNLPESETKELINRLTKLAKDIKAK